MRTLKETRRRYCGLCLGTILLLQGCTSPLTPNEQTNIAIARARAAAIQSGPGIDEGPIELAPSGSVRGRTVQAFRQAGTGFYSAGTRTASPPTLDAEAEAAPISLNFANADVREVVRSVLGDALHLPYVIDPSVQGTVTLRTPTAIRGTEALFALESALRLSGFSIVQDGQMYEVLPLAAEAGASDMVRPGVGAAGTRVINLRYVSASQIMKVLQPLLPAAVSVHADPTRNIIVVSGNEAAVNEVLNKIAIFDVDYLSGLSFELLPLQNAQAAEVAQEIQGLLAGPTAVTAGLIKITPIERLNALLVTAVRPAYLARVEMWARRLDQQSSGDTLQRKLFVYRVQNGRAASLAATLHKILSGGEGGEGSSESRPASTSGAVSDGGSALGTPTDSSVPDVLRGGLSPATDSSLPEAAHPGASPAGASGAGNGSADAMPGVRITADDENNAIIVLATSQEYATIEAALRQLDRQPLQVLIEATVAEITLSNQLSYGLQYAVKSGNFQAVFTPTGASSTTSSGTTTTSTAASGLADLLSASTSGLNLAYSSAASTSVILQLLQGLTDVRVLSSPNLLVLNDQPAELQVGDQVPVATQSSSSTLTAGSPIVNSIEYRDTGVILKVTPRVNSSGLVLLDIDQEVSSVSTTTSSNLDTPTISQRRVNSSVAIADGQTVALAGLISDTRSKTKNGIPVLQDIPYLGSLFSTTTRSTTRDELIVLITPHVVRNRLDRGRRHTRTSAEDPNGGLRFATTLMRSKREQGFVLPMVLWAAALVGLVIAGILSLEREEHRSARETMVAAQLRALADGAIWSTAYNLEHSASDASLKLDGRPAEWHFEDHHVIVRVQDELGKVDVNLASDGMLKKVFVAGGADEQEADRLSDCIQDWRERDAGKRLNGAKAGRLCKRRG